MKMYSNPTRKPMMYGGMTQPRKKMQLGGKAEADATANAEIQSRVATGRATEKDKAAMQAQRREELMRKDVEELRAIASDPEETAQERQLAKSVLREKGDKGAMPPGDQEPAEKMYGGKARKK